MKPQIRSMALALVSLSLILWQTGCLKTRAQIKGGQQEDVDTSAADAKTAGPARSTSYEMEEIKNEITRISGKVEEVEHSQRSQNVGELKEYLARLDGRIAELEKNQMLVMSEVKALKDEKTTSAREAATPSSDLLKAGQKLLAEKNFEEAAEKFRALINKGSKGKDGAEAHFGLGEAEYGLKNYKKAIVQYSKVQELSAKSARIPQSLYRIGLSFQHLNMAKEAKGFFSELAERFPKSIEAKKAKAKIKE